jgi:glucose-1-phosphate cytidylyltransferase
MKTAILAGGLGTRMQEVTHLIPKPMVKIGSHPILWHIMKHYASHGVEEFCVALGYRGDIIKDYFINYHTRQNDICVDLKTKEIKSTRNAATENWRVNLIETGEKTQTGGRIARMQDYLGNETFMLTYGDGVCDVDIKALLAFHKSHGKIGTVTAVHQPSRFGALQIDKNNIVAEFMEKPAQGDSFINGGFFVFEPGIFKYLSKDEECVLERLPLEKLANDGQLAAYHHQGFWQCMDTIRDINYLNDLWAKGDSPWKTW